MLDRTLIAMSSDMDDNDEAITGFVQSIEEDTDAVPRRWRITIPEADSQCSTRPTLCLFGAVGSQKNRWIPERAASPSRMNSGLVTRPAGFTPLRRQALPNAHIIQPE